MPVYNINKPIQSQNNFFNLAGWTKNLFEHEPLNTFDGIEAVLLETEEPWEEYFWSEPQPVSLWNFYWTEAIRNTGGLQIDDPVFKNVWTKYYSLHIDCQDQKDVFANSIVEELTVRLEELSIYNQIHKPQSKPNQRTKQLISPGQITAKGSLKRERQLTIKRKEEIFFGSQEYHH